MGFIEETSEDWVDDWTIPGLLLVSRKDLQDLVRDITMILDSVRCSALRSVHASECLIGQHASTVSDFVAELVLGCTATKR